MSATQQRQQRGHPGASSATRRAARTASSAAAPRTARSSQRVGDRIQDLAMHRRRPSSEHDALPGRYVIRVTRSVSPCSSVLRSTGRDRGVEHLDGVCEGHRWPPARRSADGDLQQAAGVGGDQQLGAGGAATLAGLAVAELARRLRVEQVVDAGRRRSTARPRRSRRRSARVCRPAASRGWRPDALGVREVAGVVVGDRHRQRVPRRHRAELDQQLGHVADLGRERRPPARRTPGRRPAARRTPSSTSRSRPR